MRSMRRRWNWKTRTRSGRRNNLRLILISDAKLKKKPRKDLKNYITKSKQGP